MHATLIIPHMLALKYIQCLMAETVSWHVGLFIQVIYIFSQLVIVSLETDRVWWVDCYWLCPEMRIFILKNVINIWNKCHLIKWLKMQQYDIKTGCAKDVWDIKRSCIAYLNWKSLIWWLRPTATSDTQTISWRWERINFTDTRKYVLLSTIMPPQIHVHWC